MANPFQQLCMIPGCMLGDATPQDFETFIQESFGCRAKFEAEVKTLPDLDRKGNPIKDTGGRNDLFFYVHEEDVTKFAVPRLQMEVRWWEDVIVYNDNSHLYSKEFIEAHPPAW